LANPPVLRLRLAKQPRLHLRLVNPSRLRLPLEKQLAKLVPAKFLVKTPEIFVLLQERLAAQAGFSSAHDGTRYWLRCGAHKGPIVQK